MSYEAFSKDLAHPKISRGKSASHYPDSQWFILSYWGRGSSKEGQPCGMLLTLLRECASSHSLESLRSPFWASGPSELLLLLGKHTFVSFSWTPGILTIGIDRNKLFSPPLGNLKHVPLVRPIMWTLLSSHYLKTGSDFSYSTTHSRTS